MTEIKYFVQELIKRIKPVYCDELVDKTNAGKKTKDNFDKDLEDLTSKILSNMMIIHYETNMEKYTPEQIYEGLPTELKEMFPTFDHYEKALTSLIGYNSNKPIEPINIAGIVNKVDANPKRIPIFKSENSEKVEPLNMGGSVNKAGTRVYEHPIFTKDKKKNKEMLERYEKSEK